jgi:hypothetical protein
VLGVHHGDAVGPDDAAQRLADRVLEVGRAGGEGGGDEVRDDLGVGLRCELDAVRDQLGAQLVRVLDDPVVHTAIRPSVSVCGWAFASVGSPCVAQRVCPMPGAPLNRAGQAGARSATRPCDLRILSPLRLTTATPAES